MGSQPTGITHQQIDLTCEHGYMGVPKMGGIPNSFQ